MLSDNESAGTNFMFFFLVAYQFRKRIHSSSSNTPHLFQLLMIRYIDKVLFGIGYYLPLSIICPDYRS